MVGLVGSLLTRLKYWILRKSEYEKIEGLKAEVIKDLLKELKVTK
jgi:hypothetical protein